LTEKNEKLAKRGAALVT